MTNLKIFTTDIETKALEQINTLIAQPTFSNCKIRIMPDVHAGAGCVIGFTANLGEKVIPNIVGVDIGCGMLTVNLGQIDVDYAQLDEVIHTYIPSGRNVHSAATYSTETMEQLYCHEALRNKERIRCSLGAGRLMSRTKARESVLLEDFKASMKGIYTTSVNRSTLDESPLAYKPMDEILENIKDTVEVECIIKPIYNFKASE